MNAHTTEAHALERDTLPPLTQIEIDQRVFDLYDEYCHGEIDRREFLARAAAVTVGGLAMAQALLPRYAAAQTISFTDPRIKARYVSYPSPGGTSGTMRGYLVQPTGQGPFPVVLVIHENRGLNPYIEDVTRRLGTSNFLALAPDGLTSVGGYPGDEEKAAALFKTVDEKKMFEDFVASAAWLKARPECNGKIGAVGFCFGGTTVNNLAVRLPDLGAAVAFYGRQPSADAVSKIKAPLLLHYGSLDTRITDGWPAYEAALKANHVTYTGYVYDGANHGFHNDTTPRYDEAAAKLSWQRTLDFFDKYLRS